MQYKILFLLFLSCLLYTKLTAQAVIEFKETTHDFEQVAEGTQAAHEFKFVNAGDAPLIISSVRASCGCTTPYWTKEPVQPGEKGIIKASYNSKNRPGSFNKSITITSNATVPVSRVYIKGTVLRPDQIKKEYSKAEIAASPRIELTKENIALGKAEIGKAIPIDIILKNKGKASLTITGVKAQCQCYTLEKGVTIAAGKKGAIQLIYTPRSIGKKIDFVLFIGNDITDSEKKISVSSEVVESLSSQSILRESDRKPSF